MTEPVEGKPAPTLQRLEAVVAGMAGKRVLVAGDPVLDVYVYGTTLRVSREAPVPIVREDGRECRLGGAANAAANLAALGSVVSLTGMTGRDEAGTELRQLADELGIDASPLVPSDDWRTITKTRILAGGLHTTKQQLLRLDRENDPAGADTQSLLDAAAANDADVMIISDYGAFTPACIQIAQAAIAAGRKVVVDSRYSLMAFKGATAATPNEPEAEAALSVCLRDETQALDAAHKIRAELGLTAALVTRGREGMVVSADETAVIAPHGIADAVDVTGAGDTVIATFTLAIAAGASVLEAAILANCAASVVVQSIGAATCGPDALLQALQSLGPDSVRTIRTSR